MRKFSATNLFLVFVVASGCAAAGEMPCQRVDQSEIDNFLEKQPILAYPDEVWAKWQEGFKDCLRTNEACAVVYQRENLSMKVFSTKQHTEALPDDIPDKERVLFGGVQLSDKGETVCIMAKNGFASVAPWFVSAWRFKGNELVRVYDELETAQFHLGMTPKELIETMVKAYRWRLSIYRKRKTERRP